ncbi:COMM domain [Trinorchestia longiramus]|nr:COMM domain [Trinorchestia longiramus]
MYVSAAKKLTLQPSQVSAAVSALMSILQRAAEHQVSEESLAKLLSSTGLSVPSQEPVLQLYEDVRSILLDCIQQQALQVPTLESLEWRLDVIAATRAAHGLAEPVVTLHLNTSGCPDNTAAALGECLVQVSVSLVQVSVSLVQVCFSLVQIKMDVDTCFTYYHHKYGPDIECAADYREDGAVPLCNSASVPLVLQTDAATLRHLSAVLESAVMHARTPHHSRLSAALS